MAVLETAASSAEYSANYHVDASVLKEFPEGAKVLEASRYSTAAWTTALRVIVELLDGSKKSYFLKCATDEVGKAMMEAEFRSMEELYYYMPEMVPRPIAWGQLTQSSPETYFLLLEFIELCMDMVDPIEFCEQIAILHKTGKSPTGKFGFHLDTFQGPNRQITQWESDWCTYFTRLLDGFLVVEIDINGPNEEYQKTFETLKTKIIPLLLKPLQSEGRSIEPCLIHGDLWEENTGTDLLTGKTVIFDASVHYAHNELELGMWRRDVIRFGKAYFRQYLRNFPPSEPVEQWDDRNRLYSLKYNLSQAMAWPASAEATREILLRDMRYLIDKYLAPSGSTA